MVLRKSAVNYSYLLPSDNPPSAFDLAKGTDGKSIFTGGKKFTGFSNVEEEQINKVKAVPFLLEDKLAALGGIYEASSTPWAVSNTVPFEKKS